MVSKLLPLAVSLDWFIWIPIDSTCVVFLINSCFHLQELSVVAIVLWMVHWFCAEARAIYLSRSSAEDEVVKEEPEVSMDSLMDVLGDSFRGSGETRGRRPTQRR